MTKQLKKSILIAIVLSQLSFLSINLFAKETNSLLEKKPIKIDIVSDVVCPWCAIGFKRLSQAIDEMKVEDKIEVEWHPFELNPDMPKNGMNANKYLMDKYNLDRQRLLQKREQVTKLGEEADFKFDYFENMKKVNTLNAHILLKYAKKFGKQTQLKVRLQHAYFSERKDISNKDVLFKELLKVGLNVKEAMPLLDKEEEIEKIRAEERFWKEQGVFSIPTMVFNNRFAVVGARSVEDYKKVLKELLK